MSQLTGAKLLDIADEELVRFLAEHGNPYQPKMEYDRILLAQGSVKASTNLIIGYGSTISAELTLGVLENTCLVIDGDLVVKGELCLDDGQGLIVLGEIRARELFSGDAELFARSIRGTTFVAIDYESGGLVTPTKAQIMSAAHSKVNNSECSEAYELLRPLLEKSVPEALFLYATFSLAETESETEFDRRSFDLLTRAADLGYAPALFAVGVCYEVGDLVEPDPSLAATYLRSAAEQGYPKAKFSHGLNVYYGSNGTPRDEESGLALIRAAAKAGVEDAEDFLKHQVSSS